MYFNRLNAKRSGSEEFPNYFSRIWAKLLWSMTLLWIFAVRDIENKLPYLLKKPLF